MVVRLLVHKILLPGSLTLFILVERRFIDWLNHYCLIHTQSMVFLRYVQNQPLAEPCHCHLPSSAKPIPLEIFLMSAFFRNSSLARLRVCCKRRVSDQPKTRNLTNGKNTLAQTPPPILPLSNALPKTLLQSSIAFSSDTA